MPKSDLIPDISIIIVNWNCGEDIFNCIDSLVKTIKKSTYEIIVVDNNSSDGSRERLEAQYSNIRLIKNDYNNMFAGANNQGYEISKGKLIFILNPDTVVTMEAVDNLVHALGDGKESVVTCTLLNKDGTVQYNMHRGFPSILRLVTSLLYKKTNYFKFLPSVKNYLLIDNNFDRDFYVEQAAGAAILIKREVINELGYLFDEVNFPLLYNDVDFSYRLYKKGLRILCKTDVAIYHLKGQSLKRVPKKEYIMGHLYSFLRFAGKHGMRTDKFMATIVAKFYKAFV